MQIKNKLIKIAGFSYFSYFVAKLLDFVFVTVAFYRVGKRFLGLWFFIIAFIGFFKYVWNSLDQSFVKDLSREYAKNDFAQLKKIISGSYVIMLTVGILSAFLIIIFNYVLMRYFPFKLEHANIFHAVFNVLVIYVFLICLTIPLKSLTMAKQKAENVHLIEALQALLESAACITIVIVYPNLKLIVGALLFVQLIILLLYLLIDKSLICEIYHERVKLPSLQFICGQLRFSMHLFLLSLAGVVLFQVDTVLIAYFLPIYFIAIYGACQKIYSLPLELALRGATGILPATSFLKGKGRDYSVKELFMMATKYSMIIYFSIGIPIFIYAYPLLNNWFGREFATGGAWVLRILLIHQWFNINHGVGNHILKGIGKVKELLAYSWICAILNLIFSILLIQKFQIVGVAVGTTIPFVLMEWYILRHLLRYMGVTWQEYFGRIVAPIYLPTVFILMFYTLFIKVKNFSVMELIAGLILTAGLMLMMYYVRLDKNEKDPITSFISRLRGVLKEAKVGIC